MNKLEEDIEVAFREIGRLTVEVRAARQQAETAEDRWRNTVVDAREARDRADRSVEELDARCLQADARIAELEKGND